METQIESITRQLEYHRVSNQLGSPASGDLYITRRLLCPFKVSNQLGSPASGDVIIPDHSLPGNDVSNQLGSPASGDAEGLNKAEVEGVVSFQSIRVSSEWRRKSNPPNHD